MSVVKRVAGCIIRLDHDDQDVLEQLTQLFHEYDQEVIDVHAMSGRDSTAGTAYKRFCFRQERMGNLSLAQWMAAFADDLEGMDTLNLLPNLGDNLHVRFELVH